MSEAPSLREIKGRIRTGREIIQYENYGIGLRLCNSWSRN
jgi:hypothetical protein